MNQPKRILICPLDWGLGHATRCIPVIRILLQKGAEVIIAVDNRPFDLFKKEFPALEFIRFKGYNIHYPDSGSMMFKMLFSIPEILKGIKAEHRTLEKIIAEKKINAVISDNRFGCWNKNIKSIFITHQLMIKSPVAEKLLHRINLSYIKNYDECWVPDTAGENNLSGDLSHKYPLPKNTFFIGALSRFPVIAREERPKQSLNLTDLKQNETGNNIYDVTAIISGPEPQRSIFEKKITEQLLKTNLKALVVCGITEGEIKKESKNNIEFISHLATNEMQEAILNSKIIIARSGYSTIMDLATLGKKAIFVPTPGQTEQEYLAENLMQKNIAYYSSQKEFNLEKALKASEKFTGFKSVEVTGELERRIDSLLSFF